MILTALQEEIKTLIAKQQTLMKHLQAEEAIWGGEAPVAELSKSELDRQIAALSSENVKVQALESTIAVIGTMKAGKSTTINALIGEDVLPHRLTAMTTLPTLIRHKPGQKEPILTLNKLEVFKSLVSEVKAKVGAVDEAAADLSKINEALETVKKRSEDIHQEYAGKDAIHQALFLINDTLRLASHAGFEIDLDHYLEAFSDITNLPTVEVEFRCLAGKPQGVNPGSLALLDTPGPNEAGQSAVLKHILSEQIKKNASMVLLVMNYTQLNTEQDSEIRRQIRAIKEVFKDRSFIVVNRFDEKKHNDLDEVQTKKLASDLLNDSIGEDDFITPAEVFPVSSHYAFIAERVKQQVEAGVEITAFVRDEKNRDFIKAAFGVMDEEEIEELSLEEVEKKSSRLLKRSGYGVFISRMLEKAYSKAGEECLKLALLRLHKNADGIKAVSTSVVGGLAESMQGLQQSILRTKDLGEAIQAVYEKLDDVKGRGVSEYRESARLALSDHVEDIKDSIGAEFDRARKMLMNKLQGDLDAKFSEKEKYGQRRGSSKSRQNELKAIESDLENLRAAMNKHERGDPGVLEFGSNLKDAEDFNKKASNVVNGLFSSMVGSLQEQLDLLQEGIQQEIQDELFGQLDRLCRDYESEMQAKGFDFDGSLVDRFSLDVLSGEKVDAYSEDPVESYTESVTRTWTVQKKREGWLHKTLKVFSFGYRDDYDTELRTATSQQPRYKIVLDDYVQNAKKLADRFYQDIEARLAAQFEEQLVPAVDAVFEDVFISVKGIEEALDYSKKLKEENVALISEVSSRMGEVKSENSRLLKRIYVAESGIGSLTMGK
tara:strand:+ start:1325 stop:3814 length:2490 start_codon:yes stop_codon:yes gene_type:complete